MKDWLVVTVFGPMISCFHALDPFFTRSLVTVGPPF
jgi:hypothetical protein